MIDAHHFVSGTGTLVVVREGGRVAELRCADEGPNVFFGGIHGIAGGDRLWPAPEVEIFYDERGEWTCPPEIDPGDWSLSLDGETALLNQSVAGMTMSRRVSPLVQPPSPTSLPWAGYRVSDELHGHERRSAWHLIMLPTPQQIYVRGNGDPVAYFPPVPAPDEGWVRTGSTQGRWKMGFDPPADGRVLLAGLAESDPGPLLVVITHADPDGTYIDVPPDGDTATAVQLFDSHDEGFCELEHHAPLETGRTEAVVTAVWGSRAERLEWLSSLPAG